MASVYIESTCVVLGQWTGSIVGVNPCVVSMSHSTKDPLKTDTVVISVQDEGVYVYSLADLKCFKNWFVSRLAHGSSRLLLASQQFQQDTFYVVLGDDDPSSLHCLSWKEKTIDLEADAVKMTIFSKTDQMETDDQENSKKKRTKRKNRHESTTPLYNSIVAMHQLPCGNQAAHSNDLSSLISVVVDSSGGVYELGQVPKFRKIPCCCIWSGSWKNYVLTMTISQEQVYELHVFQATHRLTSLKLEPPRDSVYVTSMCLESNSGLVSIIWSDGTWQLYRLALNSSMELIHHRVLIGFIQTPSLSKQPNLFSLTSMATLFLNEHHIALVAKHESKGILLMIWDVQSMTLLVEESVGRNNQDNFMGTTDSSVKSFLSEASPEFLLRDISTILGHRLVVVCGNLAVVYSVFCPQKSSLLQLIGKTEKKESTYLDTTPSLVTSDMKTNEKKLLKQLKIHYKSKDLDGFISLYKKSMSNTHEISSEIREQDQILKTPLVTDSVTRRHHAMRRKLLSKASLGFIQELMNMCFSNGDFWPEIVIDDLLRTDMVSATSVPYLLSKIMEKQSYKLLESLLLHVHDLPEKALVDTLKFILKQTRFEKLDDYAKEKETQERTHRVFHGQSGRNHFLNLILSSPHNEMFLTHHLRSLSLIDITKLMNYLKTILNQLRTKSDESRKRLSRSRLPRMQQLLDWISMILDAHFTQLVVSDEHYSLLVDIYEGVQEQLEECEIIQELRGFLSLFERHVQLPTKDILQYSIEVLQL